MFLRWELFGPAHGRRVKAEILSLNSVGGWRCWARVCAKGVWPNWSQLTFRGLAIGTRLACQHMHGALRHPPPCVSYAVEN